MTPGFYGWLGIAAALAVLVMPFIIQYGVGLVTLVKETFRKSSHGVGCTVNRDRSVQMNEFTVGALESLKSSGAFSGAQLKAIDTAIAVASGEKWTEGAVYERVAPPNVATAGDKYVATSKLAIEDGDDREFNMLNLTHRKGVPTREVYSPAKFRKIADSVANILA